MPRPAVSRRGYGAWIGFGLGVSGFRRHRNRSASNRRSHLESSALFHDTSYQSVERSVSNRKWKHSTHRNDHVRSAIQRSAGFRQIDRETIMYKTLANLALFGALCIGLCGVESPSFAGPDDGKSLVYLPAPASPASSTPCDRACLNRFIDKYFDALLSHCTCNVSFAPDVKYTENGESVKLGEGIWKTFTGRGTYRVYLADPATGEAGYYGDINEFRGILLGTVALRLKVKDRRIAEVEMIVAREQLRPKGGLGLNTAGIMTPKMIDELRPSGFVSPVSALLEPVPAAERATREQSIAITDRYFEAFTQDKGSVAPFA